MLYLLDTNIIIAYLRKHDIANKVNLLYNPLDNKNTAAISVITVGELMALSKINHWGNAKVAQIELIINELLILDIHSEQIIELYAEIDAYSQCKLKHKPLGMTSRNMGKNDLWIAATTTVSKAKFLTTDKDFSHLDKVYLDLGLIS
ncbi:MAG: type II toxin-antitoxin system VapC family toxin [Bacteroidia bacterium]